MSSSGQIIVKNACQNNLQGLDLSIPHHALTVVTGPSGSGKSSLAFDTLYAEGQRRYVETFSPYTRQFLERMDKPKADSISGIPPAIAIEQANHIRTSRSTVGTLTEMADYLKALYHRASTPCCPTCSQPVNAWNAASIARDLITTRHGLTVVIGFEMPLPAQADAQEVFSFVAAQGYRRLILGSTMLAIDSPLEGMLESPVFVVQDRTTLSPSSRSRVAEALEHALRLGKGSALVWEYREGNLSAPTRFSSSLICSHDSTPIHPKTPSLFSFNNPVGACPTCKGFGRTIDIDMDLVIPDPSLTLAQGAVKPWRTGISKECQGDLIKSCKRLGIPTSVPFRELSPSHRSLVVDGEPRECSVDEMWDQGLWYGVRGFFEYLEKRTYKMHVRVFLSRYRAYQICPSCAGTRFRPETAQWKLGGMSLPEFNAMPVAESLAWFTQHSKPWLTAKNTAVAAKEILARLGYLCGVGLGYISLDRTARTLSGGELQRVNLTSCLGASLVNTLFVLDEPSIGLHPRDTDLLIGTVRKLRDSGNTIVVVEHDGDMIRAADHIVELGPGRGSEGGRLVFQGTPEGMLKHQSSLTGAYLSGRKICCSDRPSRPTPSSFLDVRGACEHNLANISLDIPLGRFVCFTGVSGSGKSTLLLDCIYKNILRAKGQAAEEPGRISSISGHDQIGSVLLADQSPPSRTPRSNPALYVGIYDAVRELFAGTDEAKKTGLNASSFSFNSGDGRCERCAGMGWEKIEMQFLTDLFVTCPVCEGRRFQSHVLAIPYHGLSIAGFLSSTVDDAITFFSSRIQDAQSLRERTCTATICEGLQLLSDVGLGYLALGQPLSHLSGGESQRIKLAGCLQSGSSQKRKKGPSSDLIILDEPTTGLHLDDIRTLLSVFHRLVDQGHSLFLIEHHLDVIRSADWVIELGPEGGSAGGQLVFQGTPDDMARNASTHTGRFLAQPAPRPDQKRSTRRAPAPPHCIRIEGARHHNLKNLDLSLPLGGNTVVTGLSGSGKSTLAFDIIFAEGQRRYLDSLNAYARQFAQQFEKPEVDRISGIPPTVAIEQHTTRGGGKSTVGTVTEIHHFLRLLYSKLGTQHDPETDEPAIRQTAADIGKRISKLRAQAQSPLTLLAPLIRARKGFHTEVARWALRKNYALLRVDGQWIEPSLFQPLNRYQEHSIEVVIGIVSRETPPTEVARLVAESLDVGKGTLFCTSDDTQGEVMSTRWFAPSTGRSFEELDPRVFSYNSPHGWCPECQGYGTVARIVLEGESDIEREVELELKRERLEDSETLACPSCRSQRLNATARAVRFRDRTIGDLCSLSASDALLFFHALHLTGRDAEIARDILPEIAQRLNFLERVGLGYLQLNRSAKTLSGGESQRIRLASQLGSNLEGVLYVLDEPTIGLHPRDNEQLLDILDLLKSRGNSLLIVEHDEETMRRADHILDLGPGAGIHGGSIVAQGHWKEITSHTNSATGRWLGHPMSHPLRGSRRSMAEAAWFTIKGARANNLKSLDASIPLQRLVLISGVSGSGKSTLLHDILKPALAGHLKRVGKRAKTARHPAWSSSSCGTPVAQVIEVDQSPIGKTSRSTPATYTGILDDLRAWFAHLPESRARGYTAGRFSYNSGAGRCPSCGGSGTVQVEMDFLPSVKMPCETCGGKRYNPETLDILYKGRSVADILDMSVEEALPFFAAHPAIHKILELLQATGLGYLKLGQTSPTLSGGEAQRLKLVTELARGGLGHSVYLLEEPSIGLHASDIRLLLDLLHQLVDSGNTVVVIEHHLDIIAEADWVLDIGPEAGDRGGQIVAEGTPEEIAACGASHTGRYLGQVLSYTPPSKPQTRRSKKS